MAQSDTYLYTEDSSTPASVEALGRSEPFLQFMDRLRDAARVDRPVLLAGERGTGKELAASRLHYLSPRWEGPFLTLNCAALAPTIVESELFGHEAGAFTGAARRRQGRFEAADGGTMFLDEIGAMPMQVQEKLLRVVEYGVFERVGGSNPVRVDVRIIGAANVDLPALAEQGKFKRDLLDRLSFEVLTLPPLRARGEDILLLAELFAARMSVELSLPGVPELSEDVAALLMAHPWPGNVRELKNVIERAVYRSDSSLVSELEFDPFASPYRPLAPDLETNEAEKAGPETIPSQPSENIPLPERVRDLEISALRSSLRRARHNQARAARLLGLSYHQFRGLYRKYRDELETRAGDS